MKNDWIALVEASYEPDGSDPVQGHDPLALARALNDTGVEARAGCHCATLAHQALGIDASCRLSFYLYNTLEEVGHAFGALEDAVARPDRTRRHAHTDIARLEELGLVERAEDGSVSVPFEPVEILVPLAQPT